MSAPEQPVEERPAPRHPSSAATLAAAGGGALAAGRVAIAPTLAATGVQARVVAAFTSEVTEALTHFAQGRAATIIPALQLSLSEHFVQRSPEEIAKLLGREQEREREFLRRQRVRIARDLPKALLEADPDRRQARVRGLLGREKHYMRLREQAMAARAHSAVEMLDLQEASPQGAFWMLGGPVSQHTPGCVAMSNHFWPWSVLNHVIHPPVHPGCPCFLISLDEAVSRGFMRADQLPKAADAQLRARRNLALEEALAEEVPGSVVRAEMVALEEATRLSTRKGARRGVRYNYKTRRYPKGYEKGGQFMPRLGGSSARTHTHSLVPHVPKPPMTGVHVTPGGRMAWIKGHRVNVPEHREFSRTFDGVEFTSPPGGTNVYRDGELADTPDGSLHADTRRPRGGVKARVSAPAGLPEAAAGRRSKKVMELGARVEAALRKPKGSVAPISPGDSAVHAHEVLGHAGFEVDHDGAKQSRSGLVVPYRHADGHEIRVGVDRETGLVDVASWTPGGKTDTREMRARMGLEEPSNVAEPEAALPDGMKAGVGLGSGDERWDRQLSRALAGDADAQWDLVQEAEARGPSSAFVAALAEAVPKRSLERWTRRSSFPGEVPEGRPGPAYAVERGERLAVGPTVGVAIGDGAIGGPLGHGHYFTSSTRRGSGERMSLEGAHLYRPADEDDGRQLARSLALVDGLTGGLVVYAPDALGEERAYTAQDAARGLPGSARADDKLLMVEHALAMHRANPGESASTHVMRMLGYDGVDNRHIPGLDRKAHGSVVYEPQGQESPGETASPAQGGAVVRGVAGRWVWIRGKYTHVPQDKAWSADVDGVSFTSPAGGTEVYRNGDLVSGPGVRSKHADVRNPKTGGTKRGVDIPVLPPEPVKRPKLVNMTRPDVQVGQRVHAMDQGGGGIEGSVEDVSQTASGSWIVGVRMDDGDIDWVAADTLSEPLERPPEGVGFILPEEQRSRLLNVTLRYSEGEDGTRVVGSPFVTYSHHQVEAFKPSGLVDGEISVGPSWFTTTVEARQQTLDLSYGHMLARAIHDDAAGRDELSGLWTGGKFEPTESSIRRPLSRSHALDAVAEAHMWMNGDDWRAFAREYPDAARWVAAQAEQRGYRVREDVLEFIRGPETGNVAYPATPLSSNTRAFADSLVGEPPNRLVMRMREAGYVPSDSTPEWQGGNRGAWRKIEDGEVSTLTVHYSTLGERRVVAAEGAAYRFDRDEITHPGTVERLAKVQQGKPEMAADSDLSRNGYQVIGYYLGSGEGGRPERFSVYAQHDSDAAILVRTGKSPIDLQTVVLDARPTMLGPAESFQRMVAFAQTDPARAFRADMPAADVLRAVSRTSWRWNDQEGLDARASSARVGDDGFIWLTIRQQTNPHDWLKADVKTFRMQFRPAPGSEAITGATLVQVGRPSLTPGKMLATDLEDAEAYDDVQREALRKEAAFRNFRIQDLHERISASIESGVHPLTADDNKEEVSAALRKLRFRDSYPRSLKNGNTAVTWTDGGGNRIVVRMDGDRERIVPGGRITQGPPPPPDFGRERTPVGVFPDSLERFVADTLGYSDELQERYGAPHNDIAKIEFGQGDDHSGFHTWVDGRVVLGKSAKPDLLAAMKAHAEGRPLTMPERRGLYHTYKLMAHEILHGINGEAIGTKDYDARQGTMGIEESIGEELAKQVAIDWMHRHGQTDTLRWAEVQSPAGSYQVHRQNLKLLMDRMLIAPRDRRAVLEEWHYRMSSSERVADMTRRLAEAEPVLPPRTLEEQIATRRDVRPEAEKEASRKEAALIRARKEVRKTMSGSNEVGGGYVSGFIPLLAQNYARPEHLPPLLPDDAVPSVEQMRPPVKPPGLTAEIHGGTIGLGARVWDTNERDVVTVRGVTFSPEKVFRVERSDGRMTSSVPSRLETVIVKPNGGYWRLGEAAETPSGVQGFIEEMNLADPERPLARFLDSAAWVDGLALTRLGVPDYSGVSVEQHPPAQPITPEEASVWTQPYLDEEQRQDLASYTIDPVLNFVLREEARGVSRGSGDMRSAIARIDAAMDRARTPQAARVFRGSEAAVFSDVEPGDVFQEPGYTSTSVDAGTAEIFRAVAADIGEAAASVTIDVPEGSRALYLESYDLNDMGSQHEMLIHRGARYQVVSKVADADGSLQVHLRLLPPEGQASPGETASPQLGTEAVASPQLRTGPLLELAGVPDPQAEALRSLEAVIERLHPGVRPPTPPRIQVGDTKWAASLGVQPDGVYDKMAKVIWIDPVITTKPEMVVAHEYGHHLMNTIPLIRDSWDPNGPAAPEFRAWVDAINASGMPAEVNRGRVIGAHDDATVDYLMSRGEVWARAYAQWVAARSNDRRMQAQALDNAEYVGDWDPAYFNGVADAMDALFAKLAEIAGTGESA